ncbi:hypothetical protein [Nitrosococcus watsonii]|nr:hypothetical protein [Nitrosococcus watsonii]
MAYGCQAGLLTFDGLWLFSGGGIGNPHFLAQYQGRASSRRSGEA